MAEPPSVVLNQRHDLAAHSFTIFVRVDHDVNMAVRGPPRRCPEVKCRHPTPFAHLDFADNFPVPHQRVPLSQEAVWLPLNELKLPLADDVLPGASESVAPIQKSQSDVQGSRCQIHQHFMVRDSAVSTPAPLPVKGSDGEGMNADKSRITPQVPRPKVVFVSGRNRDGDLGGVRHSRSHSAYSNPASAHSTARTRAPILASVSRNSYSGTESATTPPAACR